MNGNGEEIYKCWAPEGAVWSPWVKPVLFTQMGVAPATGVPPVVEPEVGWAPLPEAVELNAAESAGYRDPGLIAGAGTRTALILDLPGAQAVATGLALARLGYRPVPLFNTCPGPKAVLELDAVVSGLRAGAQLLPGLALRPDAPPAFLLDHGRLSGVPSSGSFDNRWMVFPQDFPSSRFLREQRVARVVLVRGRSIQGEQDLDHVLRRWQVEGLALQLIQTEPVTPARTLEIKSPPRFGALWYRVLAMMGMRRNAAGGFGSEVPVPTQGARSGFG